MSDTGSRTFTVYRKLNGRPVEISLGKYPQLTVESARDLAVQHVAKLAAGVDLQAIKRAIREEATLGELFTDYLELHAKPRKRSWKEDERQFKAHLEPWRQRRLSSIHAADVQAWHARVGREAGIYAANRAHSLLHTMFAFAHRRGFKGENPAHGIQRFREHSRDRFLDGEELRRFFQALDQEQDTTGRDFFLLALLTGARRSNVLGMRWEDLNLDRGLWRIPGEKSKNGEPLVVILAPPVVALLRRRREAVADSPWVLPSQVARGKGGHYREPRYAWERILARAELSRLVAMQGEKHGWSAEEIEAKCVEAQAEIDSMRFQAFARRLPKGTDPMAIVLERQRQEVRKLGMDPTAARMKDLRIHDLRRTLGSWQVAQGASLPIIGRSLGHKNVATTAIYARLSLDPVRESVERATSAMLALGQFLPATLPVEQNSQS